MARFRSLVSLVVVGLTALALADDTWLPSMGGAPDPLAQHPTVRMEREDLLIRIPEGEVDVRYLFVNQGPATRVKMAFPGDDLKNKDIRMLDFRTWVDGKEVRAIWQPIAKPKADPRFLGHWVRSVSFAKGEKKWVRNRYRTLLGHVSDGSDIVTYFLGTGRTWKGPIGDLKIKIDASGLAEQRGAKPLISLDDLKVKFQKTGNVYTARLKDYEPKPSARLMVNWYFGLVKIDWNGVAVDDLRKPRREIIRLRNSSSFPIWRGGRVFAQLRMLAILVGGSISGLPNGAYRLKVADKSLDFHPGEKRSVLDSGAKTFVEGKGTLMVPLRPVIEYFGGKVGWNAQTGRLSITTQVKFIRQP